MEVLILTPVRMLGEGLEQCLARCENLSVLGVVTDFERLRAGLARPQSASSQPGCVLALIDVTQGVDLDEVRRLATDYPHVTLVALGLKTQHQEIVRAGRAGFGGFVPRDAAVADLIQAMRDAVVGKLACSEEIAGGLLRALFRGAGGLDPGRDPASAELDDSCLTRREGDVARLISRGLSNKEIARELDLSVATVKHHVHSVLGKLSLQRRSHVMRKVRDAPWIAAFSGPERRRAPR